MAIQTAQDHLKAMAELNLLLARLFFFAGLVYAEIHEIETHMEPGRTKVYTALIDGCKHNIPEMRQIYQRLKPNIDQYFDLVDLYVAGQASREKMIEASLVVQSMNVKM